MVTVIWDETDNDGTTHGIQREFEDFFDALGFADNLKDDDVAHNIDIIEEDEDGNPEAWGFEDTIPFDNTDKDSTEHTDEETLALAEATEGNEAFECDETLHGGAFKDQDDFWTWKEGR